jgi:hypothetical protein
VLLYESPANELVTNGRGEVIGVIAAQMGKSVAIKAKRGVVITTAAMLGAPPCAGRFFEDLASKAGHFGEHPLEREKGSRWRCALAQGFPRSASSRGH